MKSILVDALRQANGKEPDSTLSDSGSFDATAADFGPTANDEEVVPLAGPDENLELMRTSAFHTDEFDEESEPDSPEQPLALTRALNSSALAPTQNSTTAPVLARFAPLVCVLLAVVSAASWALYQQFATANHDNRFGAADMPFRSGVDQNGAPGALYGADRFPFIDSDIEIDDGAISE